MLGELDQEMGKIYTEIKIRAEELLEIFSEEKEKRGRFTYEKLPQSNIVPAKESIENATKFFKSINKILQK